MNIRIRLSKEEINKIGEFEVLNKIFQYNYQFDSKNFNFSQRALHNFFIILGDIDNGGFIQFFQNKQDEFFESGLETFKLIGDLESHYIFSEAIKIYHRNKAFLSAEDLNAPFSEEESNKLDKLESRFYDLNKKREEKLVMYVKKHVYDFVEKS